MDDPEQFDLEMVYDEQIAPLMSRIIEICREHKMPMLASFNYRVNEDGEDTCDTLLEFPGRWKSGSYRRVMDSLRGAPQVFAYTIRTIKQGD